jgi:hypothetical protein
MGYFEIDLPENKKGEVRWGILRKMRLSFFRKQEPDSKKGYIVYVTDAESKREYRLFKSRDGEWSRDPDGKVKLEDDNEISIKNAIVEKESGIL